MADVGKVRHFFLFVVVLVFPILVIVSQLPNLLFLYLVLPYLEVAWLREGLLNLCEAFVNIIELVSGANTSNQSHITEILVWLVVACELFGVTVELLGNDIQCTVIGMVMVYHVKQWTHVRHW